MAQKYVDSFGTRKVLAVDGESYDIFRLDQLEKAGFKNVSRLPVRLRFYWKTCSGKKTTITSTRLTSKRWPIGMPK